MIEIQEAIEKLELEERAELWDCFQAQEDEETDEILAAVDKGIRSLGEQGEKDDTKFWTVRMPGETNYKKSLIYLARPSIDEKALTILDRQDDGRDYQGVGTTVRFDGVEYTVTAKDTRKLVRLNFSRQADLGFRLGPCSFF